MALLEKIVAVIMPDGFLPLKKPYRRSNPKQDGAALHLQQLYGSVLIEKSVSEENASETDFSIKTEPYNCCKCNAAPSCSGFDRRYGFFKGRNPSGIITATIFSKRAMI